MAAIVIILLFVFKSNSGQAIEISVEKVKTRDITETVSANGQVQPEVGVKISSDVSGEIMELVVKEGGKVEKGDLLVKINPVIYQSMVDRMVASLNMSRANFENAKAHL